MFDRVRPAVPRQAGRAKAADPKPDVARLPLQPAQLPSAMQLRSQSTKQTTLWRIETKQDKLTRPEHTREPPDLTPRRITPAVQAFWVVDFPVEHAIPRENSTGKLNTLSEARS
jgi:hypothetical protein